MNQVCLMGRWLLWRNGKISSRSGGGEWDKHILLRMKVKRVNNMQSMVVAKDIEIELRLHDLI